LKRVRVCGAQFIAVKATQHSYLRIYTIFAALKLRKKILAQFKLFAQYLTYVTEKHRKTQKSLTKTELTVYDKGNIRVLPKATSSSRCRNQQLFLFL